MTTPKNIFGDPSIPARTVGSRPHVILGIGDSIPAGWYPRLYSELPGLVGMDDAYCQLLGGSGGGGSVIPPGNPGTFVSHYESYEPRFFAGSATLAASATAGATSVSINYVAGGYAQTGMKITIGGETIAIGASFTMSTSPTNPITVPLASALAANHTSGAAVTWTRPSGSTTGYCFNANSEIVFAAGANPASSAWYDKRLCALETPNANGPGAADEASLFHDGLTFANGPLTISLVYLAGPNSPNFNALQLNGVPAGTGYPTPAGITSAAFNPYSATLAIRTVSINLPAPVGYSTANRGCLISVNPTGIGTYAGGEVFAPMMIIVQKTGATSGYLLLCGANGGFTLGDYSGTRPQIMSPAFQSQYITALAASPIGGLDTLMIQLGINGWVSQSAGLADYRTIYDNIKAANPAARCIVSSYYPMAATYNNIGPQISAAAQQFAFDAGVVNFDWHRDCGDFNFVNTFLGDGVHPSSPWGQKIFARTQADFFARSAATQVFSASGHYADQSDVEDIFGTDNITRWSQLNTDSTDPDLSRILRALEYADATIDDQFRGGPYAVPLSIGNLTVTHWAAVIAGMWLYRSRAVSPAVTASFTVSAGAAVSSAVSPSADPYAAMLAAVEVEMDRHKAGVVWLDVARAEAVSDAPSFAM